MNQLPAAKKQTEWTPELITSVLLTLPECVPEGWAELQKGAVPIKSTRGETNRILEAISWNDMVPVVEEEDFDEWDGLVIKRPLEEEEKSENLRRGKRRKVRDNSNGIYAKLFPEGW